MLLSAIKKNSGILGLAVIILHGLSWGGENFLSPVNLENLTQRTSLFAILGIGVAFVIVTGGIDLSIGSVVGLTGTLLALLLTERGWPVPLALLACVAVSAAIGLAHGLLVTTMRLQPFVVTLCGLLIYRGIARAMTGDQTQGFGRDFPTLKIMAKEKLSIPVVSDATGFDLPVPFLIMLAIAILASVFLNRSIWGRYLLALGRNEQAARLSGIDTGRMTLMAYVICSVCAGLGGILFALDNNTVQPPSTGNFYELYAIAAAVLGGCSLRGGEGSIFGVIVGTLTLILLRNGIVLMGIPDTLEYAVMGGVLLLGVLADEFMRRFNQARLLRQRSA